jgi:hypothetical protein
MVAMKALTATSLALALFAASAAPSHAGIYSDELAKCLVASTSNSDRSLLVRWIFSTAALHPDVSSIAAVTPAQREGTNRATGQLIDRLLTVACSKQTRDALKLEGPQALQSSFQVLGQVAMRSLMENPAVAQGFQGMGKYMDEKKILDMAQ